jgi:hypothetical protein
LAVFTLDLRPLYIPREKLLLKINELEGNSNFEKNFACGVGGFSFVLF